MISMMNNVKDEGDSFEDLQKMFVEMVGGNGAGFELNDDQTSTKRARVNASRGNAAKRARVNASKGNAAKRGSSCC
ncbi:hypothetical protein OIU85_005183 [Salix viminalis]|uniref:Uncharacterized protein n=1 Tax=Salix viminalis TaxID=40686 RepID=A0A9Q0SYK0_SALVM|nr:hypothetical protein OIU85_005183 [Salix viminalis]